MYQQQFQLQQELQEQYQQHQKHNPMFHTPVVASSPVFQKTPQMGTFSVDTTPSNQQEALQRQLSMQMNKFHIQTPVTESVPSFQLPVQMVHSQPGLSQIIQNEFQFQQQHQNLQQQFHQQEMQQHSQSQLQLQLQQNHQNHQNQGHHPAPLNIQHNSNSNQLQQQQQQGPNFAFGSAEFSPTVDNHARLTGQVKSEELDLTIEDILNSDPFENTQIHHTSFDDNMSPDASHGNYTHNEEEDDALISSLIELDKTSPNTIPLGLGLDMFTQAPPVIPAASNGGGSDLKPYQRHMKQISTASTISAYTAASTPSPGIGTSGSGSGSGGTESTVPTTPVFPPTAPFSRNHSRKPSSDLRSPKKPATSPSKGTHSFNVSKKQLRKSSSFTNGIITSSSTNSNTSPAGPGLDTRAAPFQVQISSSGTIKQQPLFSLSDCSNSFSINSSENFSFVMEMGPSPPSSAVSSSSNSKLRRKSLSKILPRSSIEKPGLRKTQSSYFSHDIEVHPQKVLKEMNDGVVIFQLDTSRK